jgi:hypothetical protein
MATYRIENARSRVVLGEYEGTSQADALDTMARDAGYANYHACCMVAPPSNGEIIVTLIKV